MIDQLYFDFSSSSSLLASSSCFFNFTLSSFAFSNSTLSLSTSRSAGDPKYFFTKSIALLGLSGYSYSPTRTLVSWSITPAFSRYFLNSSFFDSVV